MSLSPNIPELLKNVPLFSGLSSEVLKRYVNPSKRLSIESGKTLLAPGDENENIYIILSGRLRVTQDASDERFMTMLGEGESVSEMSLLSGGKSLDYIIADTDCELLCIDLATVWALLKSSHLAAINMLNILSRPVNANSRIRPSAEEHHGYSGFNYVDELTGLHNREWILKMFERRIRRLSITHEHAVLMVVSIDRFEQYNESYGQLGGDQALRTLAQTFLACLRPDDNSGRFRGAVFAVFLTHTSLEESHIAAQRLLSQAAKAEVVTPGGDALPNFTVSIGLAEVQEQSSIQQLLDVAEGNMRIAQNAGGNCIRG